MLRAIPAATATLLAACSTVPTVPGVPPYRIEIQQGNYVSQEMVAQLKPGMSREQVRFILGTPLVTDIFHADRWDYVYYRELPGGKREQRRISVHFADGKLARVAGDVVPAEPTAPAPERAKPAPGKPASAAAKPSAPAAQPAAEPAASPAQSWTTRDWEAEEKAERAAQEKAAREAQAKPVAEERKERGFFGRMLEKIGF